MKPRLILLCSSLVLVLAMGAFQYGIIRLPARQQPEVEGPAAVVDTFFKWRPTHSIDDAGEMLADAYRLAPDARFLRAIEDVPRLSGEQNVRTARAQWRDRQWLVSYGEQSIGTLPEWPRFSDAESLLTNWAKRWANPALAPPSPAARQSLDAGNPLGALEILDERWKLGARDPQMFAQSGEALAWLRFCCAGDVTSHSDAIAGRAMAALALARAGGVTTSRTSAMLARDLGYCSDAERMALAMPDGDAVRAWVFADSMSLLHRTTASPTTRLLRLRWFAESEQFDRWLESVGTAEYAAKGGGHLPLYTGLLFERFDASGTVPRQVFVTAALETQRWKRADT
ncbi:MAG: hypothetical protein KA756_14500, partial [Steroidobacteraceae bacterium]|nr:hypothetical protein [Steroidobacteraceae bacterium]